MESDRPSMARQLSEQNTQKELRRLGAVDTLESLIEEMNSAGYGIHRMGDTKLIISRLPGERWWMFPVLLRWLRPPTIVVSSKGPDELVVTALGGLMTFRGNLADTVAYLVSLTPR